MKQYIVFLSFALFLNLSLAAQISITSADMPEANDSVKWSTVENVDQFNFAATGANYYWDFSNIKSSSFTYDGYVSVSESPALFQLVFNPSVANLATKRPDVNVFTVSMQNGYTYYMNNALTFQEVGFGAEINGLPIPVVYSSPDVLYAFPLNYQKNYSSHSAYDIQIPGMGSLSQKRQRSSIVDGWGIIKTPYGTFECIRVTSTVYQEDSIFIDALPIPFPSIPSSYTEYTWLSKKEHYPVMKATDNGMFGVSATYIDSSNYFEELVDPEISLQCRIYPNPASEFMVIETNQDSFRIDIYDIRGTRVFSKTNFSGNKVVLNMKPLSSGLYFIKMESKYYTETSKIIIH